MTCFMRVHTMSYLCLISKFFPSTILDYKITIASGEECDCSSGIKWASRMTKCVGRGPSFFSMFGMLVLFLVVSAPSVLDLMYIVIISLVSFKFCGRVVCQARGETFLIRFSSMFFR